MIYDRIRKVILLFSIILPLQSMAAENSVARDSVSDLRFGINLRPAYIMPTHGFYNGWNALGRPLKAGGSIHAQFAFAFPQTNIFGKLYPSAYQGIGIGAHSFGSHEMVGTPVSIYLFQGARIARLTPGLDLGYEWNFGLSSGWRTCHDSLPDGQPCNEVIASHLNAYINVGLLLSWHLNPRLTLVSGLEYTHFSNGDTMFPNGGANTLGIRIGIVAAAGKRADSAERQCAENTQDISADRKQDITYDILGYGAWRADRMFYGTKLFLLNETFAVAGLNFNPLYHFNHYLAAGASLDLIYDESADLRNLIVDENDMVLGFERADVLSRLAAGISLRGELSMPIFSVNLGAGYNILHKGEDLKGLYAIFDLKAFLSPSIFLHIGYRLSNVLYSHNLMFGVGYRFH